MKNQLLLSNVNRSIRLILFVFVLSFLVGAAPAPQIASSPSSLQATEAVISPVPDPPGDKKKEVNALIAAIASLVLLGVSIFSLVYSSTLFLIVAPFVISFLLGLAVYIYDRASTKEARAARKAQKALSPESKRLKIKRSNIMKAALIVALLPILVCLYRAIGISIFLILGSI